MVKLTIDNQAVEVNAGTTVLQAARKLGIEIPTMCYLEETGHITSCMVCLVKNARTGHLSASCSSQVSEGMVIITNDAEVLESRRMALSLLLSEHVGDCEAPCQLVCPAHMNIPLMNRLIVRGEYGRSLQVVKRDIALPAILGYICPAPCEAGCRRKQVDEAVSICHLKRFVAEEDLATGSPYQPPLKKDTGKRVAIVGAGPAGLAAAWYLRLEGHEVVVFDKNSQPGGELTNLGEEILPSGVLEKEIATLLSAGIILKPKETIDVGRLTTLAAEYDAVVIATGQVAADGEAFGLKRTNTGIAVDKNSYLTSMPKVFAIGNALRPSKMAVRSVGQGKEVAWVINRFLDSGEVRAFPERFNSRFGLLASEELEHYQKESKNNPREKNPGGSLSRDEAVAEAERCMHCDCRKPDNCLLRDLSDLYGADQKRYSGGERKKVEKHIHREGIIYEPAKCIKCGICVKLTSIHREELGLTFIGRGFDVKVGVPFNETIREGLAKTAEVVAKACPTGALAMDKPDDPAGSGR